MRMSEDHTATLVSRLARASGIPSSAYRALASLLLLLLAACPACHKRPQNAIHKAVGEWHATDGTAVLHIFDGGSGSFDERSCTWEAIDESSVRTNCERALVDNAVWVFRVTEKDGSERGSLESFPTVVFIRKDSTQDQALQPEAASAQVEDDCRSTLEPTSIDTGEAIQALGGQVLIAVWTTSVASASATLKVTLPDLSVRTMTMPVGSRQVIRIDREAYFLDLLEVGSSHVKVSLTRKK